MPKIFNENASTEIHCMVEFTNKTDKTGYLKIYDSTLFCWSEGLPSSVIDEEDIPCRIVCFINDSLSEPTENSVAICSGRFCDMGKDKPVVVTLLNKNE